MNIRIPVLLSAGMILIAACQPVAFQQTGVDFTGTVPPLMGTTLATMPVPPVTAAPAETGTALFPSPTAELTLMPPLEEIPPEAQPLIDLAIQALVRKIGVPAGQIHVQQATAVTWRDASLGCPKPGVDYLRVETPGYSILLEVNGNTYPFHTDLTNRVVQCASKPPGDIFLTP